MEQNAPPLSTVLSPLQQGKNSFSLPANWMQGRTGFGGATVAAALCHMVGHLGEPRPVRSLLVSFIAPIGEGQVDAETIILRSGKSVTQAQSVLKQNDQVALNIMAAFGHDRPTKSVDIPTPFTPEKIDFDAPPIRFPKGLPAFLSNFDIRWLGGGIPSSASNDSRLGMWVRHLNADGLSPLERLVSIADMPPPLMMSHYNRPINASSLTWSLDIVHNLDGDNDWYYLDYRLDKAHDGYQVQSGRIFAKDGTLLALSRQCMVYFE